jgi:hypothetical protein
MITEKQYSSLWKKHFHEIANQEMPSYEEYLKREEFFETYLKTLSGSEVKYILVAEAAPFSGAYFYNYNLPCGLLTPYFNQVAKALEIDYKVKLTKENALNILMQFAQRGVLLLDLFPFALIYSTTLRRQLINRGVLKHFWEGDDYSIKTQIQRLCKNLDANWDLCLIAPPIISNHIVENFHALDIKPCNNGNHNQTTFKDLHPHNLRSSDYKKVGVSSSGYPNATLIKIAFDL